MSLSGEHTLVIDERDKTQTPTPHLVGGHLNESLPRQSTMDFAKEQMGESPLNDAAGTGILVHDVEDMEVSHRTKDKVHHHHHHNMPHKHKTSAHMDNEEEDDGGVAAQDGLAIPDYGGEDIDEEEDEDYGSSEGGNSGLENRL